jgi:hypothetical protein
MCEQQYQAEVLDELKQLEYNIKLETKKGEYERAIVNKRGPSCGDIKSITSLCKEALCKQENQCC